MSTTRSAKVDRLDTAIDQVSARMVQVRDDEDLALRIASALPERHTWLGWLSHSWAPRLAMIAMVVAAGLVWGNHGQIENAPIEPPLASVQPTTALAPLVASVRDAEPNRTMPLKHLEPMEPMEPMEFVNDFERSLDAIAAPDALVLQSLAPPSLPEDAPLTLEPLVIADLPLTAETFSPR
jgi:hypothetical protein